MHNSVHPDLLLAQELIYDLLKVKTSEPKSDPESAEYGAADFTIDSSRIKFRVSKITPRKTGQFVTIWERGNNSLIKPFDISDGPDFVIISSRDQHRFGQFIFPKEVLHEKGIISGNGKKGKLGIRVYPPWDSPASAQAIRTQNWQSAWFLDIPADKSVDIQLAKQLLDQV